MTTIEVEWVPVVPRLKSEVTAWLEAAEPVIEQYEKVREVSAALNGEEYIPVITAPGGEGQRIRELEKALRQDRDALQRAREQIDLEIQAREGVQRQIEQLQEEAARLRSDADVAQVTRPTPEELDDLRQAKDEAQRKLGQLREDFDRLRAEADETITIGTRRIEELEGELESARKANLAGGGKLDPWSLPNLDSLPDDAPASTLRRNKGIGSDAAFAVLPQELLDGYQIGQEFRVVRQGDMIVLVKADKEPGARKEPVSVGVEEVRDWAVKVGRPFTRRDVCQQFEISASSAGTKLAPLVEKQILLVGDDGRTYTYNKDMPNGPTSRPRNEVNAGKSASRDRAVPGTGRPPGPAPTPGKLKRQQAAVAKKGGRVRHKPVKGVRP